MKILEIAPLWERVPPPAYGGTEAVVHLLVEELVKSGHDVTLWASGDSHTSARLRSVYPQSLRTANLDYKSTYSWLHAAMSLKDADRYDIIHNHAGEEVMALSHLVPGVPILSTMHCLITRDTKIIWDHYEGYYNTISWSQRRLMMPIEGGIFAGAVYNGIDVPSFPFQEKKGEDLLFLGRLSPEKGPHLAVAVAKMTGRRLIIAGKVDPNNTDIKYFHSVMEPLIDGCQIVYAGEADAHTKRELYRNAYCVLAPLVWDEPFGLVLAESLACGTPVIAFNRGAAAEVVEHGKTGFVVDDTEEMAAAVRLVPEIVPWDCRRAMAEKFDGTVMASSYLALYEAVLDGNLIRLPEPATTPSAVESRQRERPASAQIA